MADKKISDLPAILSVTPDDVLPIVDVSTSITLKATVSQIADTVESQIVAGSIGGIQYNEGSGFGSNAAQLFWNVANNRLGIGTSIPAAKLSVGLNNQFQVNDIGNITKLNNVTISFPSTQGGVGTVLTNDGTGNLSWTTVSGGGGGSLTGSGVAGEIAVWNSASSLLSYPSLTFDGSALNVFGNIVLDKSAARTLAVGNQTTTNAGGSTLTLRSGGGNGTGAGGQLLLSGGIAGSTNAAGGAVLISGSNSTGTGTAGSVSINAGGTAASSAQAGAFEASGGSGITGDNIGGNATILGGSGGSTKAGGAALVRGGTGNAGGSATLAGGNGTAAGGNVFINAGTGTAGGSINIQAQTGGSAVVNYNKLNSDFEIKGQTLDSLFFVDASTNRVGIGTLAPASIFSVGAGNEFQVNFSGDLVKIKNVSYQWPSAAPGANGLALTVSDFTTGQLAWTVVSGGGGSTSIGSAIAGSTPGSVLFIDSAGTLAQNNANFYWDNANVRLGIGTATPAHKLHFVNSLPDTASNLIGVNFANTTTVGSAPTSVTGITADLNAGYTGTGRTAGLSVSNAVAGLGNLTVSLNTANYGVLSQASATTIGTNVGIAGVAENGNANYAVLGKAVTSKAVVPNVGVIGVAANSGLRVGGYFQLYDTGSIIEPSIAQSAALIADSGSDTAPIFIGRNGGIQVVEIKNNGNVVVQPTAGNADHTLEVISSTLVTGKSAVYASATLSNDNAVTQVGAQFVVTTAGTGNAVNQKQEGVAINLAAGYTGSNATVGLDVANASAGTSQEGFTGSNSTAGNVGVWSEGQSAGSGANIGVFGTSSNSTYQNYGVVGSSKGSAGVNYGVVGRANIGGAISAGIGVLGLLPGPTGSTFVAQTAAILADNGATAADILVARDNGTKVFSVADGGTVNIHSGVVQVNGLTPAPTGVSGVGVIYYDSVANKFKVNENNTGYVDLVSAAASMNAGTIKGRAVGAGTGAPQDLTSTQATAILDVVSTLAKGLVPQADGVVNSYLSGDGTWRTLPSSGGAVAGNATEVQFNNGSGAFGASSNFTFNTSNNTLSVTGALSVTGGGPSSISATSNNITLATVTSGNISVSPAGNFNVNSGAAGSIINDINIGNTAGLPKIGRSGITTLITGTLSVNGALTVSASTTSTISTTAGDISLNAFGITNIGTSTGSVTIGRSGSATNINGSYSTNISAVASLNIDCSLGNYFTKTINANSIFTVSNIPSTRSYSFTLELEHTSGSITWFSGVEWPNSIAPSLTIGKTHLFMFHTDNGGVRWRASSLVNYIT